MKFLFLAFGGLAKSLSRRSARPAVSPAARPTSLPQAANRIVESMPSTLKVVDRRKTATATERKTQPVESPKPSRSGGRVGGKKPSTGNSTVVGNDTTVPMGPVYLKGPQKNTVISYTDYDASSPPPPMEVAYEVGQTGSPKRLNEYKKMYKGSTYEIPAPTLSVGGTGTNQERKFRPSTMAGFGRKNVVWPYWIHDYYSGQNDQLTASTSCFNRRQIEGVLFKMWEATGISDSALETVIEKIENTVGGDVRVDFPLDYIECEYKYFNNNIAMPIDLSLYVCTPVKDLTSAHSPMYDWFNPGTANVLTDAELMLPSYYYEPVLTAAQNVMFANNGGTLQNIAIRAQRQSILTASTEVVPEATPQGFSVKFRRNWNVMHVQQFHLMPQQELIVKFRVKLSKLLDLKRMLAYDRAGQKYQSFADLTMFPMVTFQGQDTTAVSSRLQRSGTTDMNRFLDTTAPRSSASMLSTSMTTRARVHTKTAPLRNFTSEYAYTVGDILDIFSVSKRELLDCDDPDRGEQCPYYQVNDNLGYFCNKDTKPGTNQNYYLSQIVRLALKYNGGALPDNTEPTAAALQSIDTDSNWGMLESKTTSRTTLEKTGSDISK